MGAFSSIQKEIFKVGEDLSEAFLNDLESNSEDSQG